MGVTPVGFAQCSALFTIPGDAGPAFVVTGHDVSGLTSIIQVLDALSDSWTANPGIMDIVSDDVSLLGISVSWQESAGDPIISARTLAEPGRRLETVTLPQVSYLAQKISGLGGRKNRGRMYLPGVAGSDVERSGYIMAGQLPAVAGAFAALLTHFSVNAADLVILHTNPADTPTPVVALEASDKVATQRRRLR